MKHYKVFYRENSYTYIESITYTEGNNKTEVYEKMINLLQPYAIRIVEIKKH